LNNFQMSIKIKNT